MRGRRSRSDPASSAGPLEVERRKRGADVLVEASVSEPVAAGVVALDAAELALLSEQHPQPAVVEAGQPRELEEVQAVAGDADRHVAAISSRSWAPTVTTTA